jgi:hypothetical protein
MAHEWKRKQQQIISLFHVLANSHYFITNQDMPTYFPAWILCFINVYLHIFAELCVRSLVLAEAFGSVPSNCSATYP